MAQKNKKKGPSGNIVAQNRKARRDYTIVEEVEAGIMLTGTEVKSLRLGRGSLVDAYAADEDGDIYLYNADIPKYEQAALNNHEPKRSRKLLAHKREIEKLRGRLTTRGYTLVPLQVYFKNGVAKIQLGLGKGKKLHDDRESIRRKQDLREARDAMRRR